jgi:glycerol dehydrogenase-like iron-containing ADH family enzyme
MLRPPETVRDCLRRAKAAYRAEDIGCSRERLADVLRHSHEIRGRFTVLDLAVLSGILPRDADELVAGWS